MDNPNGATVKNREVVTPQPKNSNTTPTPNVVFEANPDLINTPLLSQILQILILHTIQNIIIVYQNRMTTLMISLFNW